MDILTNTLSILFRYRQKQIEKFGDNLEDLQKQQLKKLIASNRSTEWGKSHHYNDIHSYNDFANQVPVNIYDDLKPYIEQMLHGGRNILCPSGVKWYAKSSGTTNDKSKFIPVNEPILHQCHYQGGFDSVALYLRNYEDSHLFSRKNLILGGSHSPHSINPYAHCGDLSAVLLQHLNPLVNLVRVPSKQIILMSEWEEKIKQIVAHTRTKDVVSLSGVPSWMLVLIKAVMKSCGAQYLTEVWPNLEVFFHGGISFEPYRERYKQLIPSDRMHYMETYNASEGFFGLQDDPSDHSLLLMPDYGIYYEFIPMSEVGKENPTTIPAHEVKTGVNYAMVISTVGGLWRYQIGDTVRFTSLFPHKFVISGRTKHFINAFGEELMVDNADKAISATCHITGAKIAEYTAAPLFLLDKGKGRHQWVIEFDQEPASMEFFTKTLDEQLQSVNSDYEAKRYKEISLQMPEVIAAPHGTFYNWLENRGKLGGQHKIPRLSNDRKIIEELLNGRTKLDS